MAVARHIIARANDAGTVLLLPVDVVVSTELKTNARHRTVPVREVGEDDMILDVGPDTIDEFERRLQTTSTLVWNGPFGAFETEPFDRGTVAAAKLVAAAHPRGQAFVGGGRRRYSGRPQPCRRGGGFHLRLHRGRGVSGMAGRTGIAGRGGTCARKSKMNLAELNKIANADGGEGQGPAGGG